MQRVIDLSVLIQLSPIHIYLKKMLKESHLKKITFFTLIGPLNPTQTIQMSCVNYHAKRTWPYGPYPIGLMMEKVLNLL